MGFLPSSEPVVDRSRKRGDRRKDAMNGRTAFVGEVRGSGCSPVTTIKRRDRKKATTCEIEGFKTYDGTEIHGDSWMLGIPAESV